MATKNNLSRVLAGLVFALSASMAQGALITWEFSVRADIVSDGGLSLDVSAGDVFTGRLSYESTTADADPGNTQSGAYQGAPRFAQLQLGSDVAEMDNSTGGIIGATMAVSDNFSIDTYSVNLSELETGTQPDFFLNGAQLIFPVDFFEFVLILQDTTNVAITDNLLPLEAPSLDLFDVRIFAFVIGTASGGTFGINGEIVSLRSVPEPHVLALMGLGLAGIGYRRKQSKKA